MGQEPAQEEVPQQPKAVPAYEVDLDSSDDGCPPEGPPETSTAELPQKSTPDESVAPEKSTPDKSIGRKTKTSPDRSVDGNSKPSPNANDVLNAFRQGWKSKLRKPQNEPRPTLQKSRKDSPRDQPPVDKPKPSVVEQAPAGEPEETAEAAESSGRSNASRSRRSNASRSQESARVLRKEASSRERSRSAPRTSGVTLKSNRKVFLAAGRSSSRGRKQRSINRIINPRPRAASPSPQQSQCSSKASVAQPLASASEPESEQGSQARSTSSRKRSQEEVLEHQPDPSNRKRKKVKRRKRRQDVEKKGRESSKKRKHSKKDTDVQSRDDASSSPALVRRRAKGDKCRSHSDVRSEVAEQSVEEDECEQEEEDSGREQDDIGDCEEGSGEEEKEKEEAKRKKRKKKRGTQEKEEVDSKKRKKKRGMQDKSSRKDRRAKPRSKTAKVDVVADSSASRAASASDDGSGGSDKHAVPASDRSESPEANLKQKLSDLKQKLNAKRAEDASPEAEGPDDLASKRLAALRAFGLR